jgi:hypothetical protein
MFSSRRIAAARSNPPNTVTGNGIARKFTGHTDHMEAILFKHNMNGFPTITLLDTLSGEIEYAKLSDDVPNPDWDTLGDTEEFSYVKYIDKNTVSVWTTLSSGVISVE